jgi:hypothetical protein
MSKRLSRWGQILVVGSALAVLSGAPQARDPGINQPGVRGGTAGVGAPGVGVRDPGINQPGAAGNVGAARVGVGAPGVGVVDPGINQPGVAGNVGGVARRSVRY